MASGRACAPASRRAWETHSGHKPEGRGDQDDKYEQDRRDDRRAEPKGRAARAAKEAARAVAASATNKAESGDGASGNAALGQSTANAPPTAWAGPAKQKWSELPPGVRAAVAKREDDVARGVQQLQQKYANIDAAIAPYMNAIRAHGHADAGAAIKTLFSWHDHIQKNPSRASPTSPSRMALTSAVASSNNSPSRLAALINGICNNSFSRKLLRSIML